MKVLFVSCVGVGGGEWLLPGMTTSFSLWLFNFPFVCDSLSFSLIQ